MPIYAYRCDACGFAKDALQKVSDAPLTVCPSCGKSEFKKQLTAAGFQLKGSGWYVTDFRGGSSSGASSANSASTDSKPAETSAQKSDGSTASASDGGSKTTTAS